MLQVRYVEAQLKLRALTSVATGTAAFTLLVPGSAGMSLHAKGTDSVLREKLEAQLEQLAVKLDLPTGASLDL